MQSNAIYTGMTSPAIYDMVPPPVKPAPRFFMERFNLERGAWLKAEPSMQRMELGTMINTASALPDFLRVVVLDWKDAAVPLDCHQHITTGVDDLGLWVRPRKGAQKLVLTIERARAVPALRVALAELTRRRLEEAAKREATAREAARAAKTKGRKVGKVPSQPAPSQPAPARQASAKRAPKARTVSVPPGNPGVIAQALAQARGNTAMAEAMRRAVRT